MGLSRIFQVQGPGQSHDTRYIFDGRVRSELLDQCLLQRLELIDGYVLSEKIVVRLPGGRLDYCARYHASVCEDLFTTVELVDVISVGKKSADALDVLGLSAGAVSRVN